MHKLKDKSNNLDFHHVKQWNNVPTLTFPFFVRRNKSIVFFKYDASRALSPITERSRMSFCGEERSEALSTWIALCCGFVTKQLMNFERQIHDDPSHLY